jgi:hypothetical protein
MMARTVNLKLWLTNWAERFRIGHDSTQAIAKHKTLIAHFRHFSLAGSIKSNTLMHQHAFYVLSPVEDINLILKFSVGNLEC